MMIRRRGRSRGRARRLKPRSLAFVLAIALGVVVAGGLWLFAPYWRLSAQLGPEVGPQPSRLYGASMRLTRGMPVSVERLESELARVGYRATGSRSPKLGEYHLEGARLLAHLRSFPGPGGLLPEGLLGVVVSGGRVHSLYRDGRPVEDVLLEPPLLTAYYGPDRLDRWPVPVEQIPEELIAAVMAAEDARFYQHGGLSARGILRAAWVNLRGGEIRQGGSTLTQQLVKNLYLTHERTLSRKLREAVLASLVELRYGKDAILQAYVNEIYWGQRAGVNVMGVGSAARAYFQRTPRELTLGQAALLAALIRAPGDYDPAFHPERAQERRDWVLDRMVELEWLDAERAEAAKHEPVDTVSPSPLQRRAPFFAEAVRREAMDRFGVDPHAAGGYSLLTTLSPADQQAAEEAVAWGVEALENGWEKGRETAVPLEAALVSADPRSGEILAYVGGRDFARSQFDRVGQARRQAGSAFKPIVYLTAFERRQATPATLIEDSPLTVQLTSGNWSPGNYDSKFHGWVTARRAVVQSYNVATARMALQTGLSGIVDTAQRLGVEGELQAVPALALGAFEVTPIEMATAYATLAAGGLRPELHGLRGMVDGNGQGVAGRPPRSPERAVSPAATYVVTALLQDVIDRGTGAEARRMGLTGPLAGKTGTSNDRRDNWFAGYTPDRVAVVWVGYDDNSPTRMSGARAGLPIWTRFMHAVRPVGGYREFAQPAGVATALIDPLSGGLATDACPQVQAEVFLEGTVPSYVCHLHGGWFNRVLQPQRVGGDGETIDAEPGMQPEEGQKRHPFRRWLKRVFGSDAPDDTY
ncbi:MAG: PBP1A family penicillin-binding protein [Thermoanaerobaculia bacterium]